MNNEFDFGGYATKVNLQCTDGRTIRKDAFKDCDGMTVPLVWQHQRDEIDNVLGHAVLENRSDGVYAHCKFNDTDNAEIARRLVKNRDISSLSIYANHLKQNGKDVVHGKIIEVSLVYAGANPGAKIDNVVMEHGDGGNSVVEAIIYADLIPVLDDLEFEHKDENQNGSETEMEHAATETKSEKTVQEIFDSMTDEQKEVVYAMVGYALGEDEDEDDAEHDDEDEDDESLEHTDNKEETKMKNNVFESHDDNTETLSHADVEAIFDDAKRFGSLKDAVVQHGVDNLEILFPEAKAESATPTLIMRDQEWVNAVWGGAHKTPFSRVKSVTADITKDEARAKGYIKGKKKLEEQFALLKRVTTPQTVYKLQSMDRDDIIDIVDFDFVAFLRAEMRLMLIEELARAMLVGDGRTVGAEDKISEDHIRPIAFDNDLYAIHYKVDLPANATREQKTDAIIDAANLARVDYRGSGSPTMFIEPKALADMLLSKDKIGRRLYNNVNDLATAMRTSKIVEVPVMDHVTRTTEDGKTMEILGIIVNMRDYTVGADKGGAVTMFDDFDIQYNKERYLIETRCSGALTVPYSAIILETEITSDDGGDDGGDGGDDGGDDEAKG